MKVLCAEAMGFCHGVRSAVERVENAAARYGTLYCLHDVAHNQQVMEALRNRGVVRVTSVDEIPEASAVAVTAHGATVEAFEAFVARGLQVIDATCSIVRNAQRKVEALASEGRYVIVYGDGGHQEVRGLLSHASSGGEATDTKPRAIPKAQALGLVSQTTRTPGSFRAFAETVCADVRADCRAEDTTCEQPRLRYQSAVAMAAAVDAYVVIGSKTSANCNHLAAYCARTGRPTFFVASSEELEPADFASFDCIGLTAGASTPDSAIEAVASRLREL